MGFGAFAKNPTNGFAKYMRGYPLCETTPFWEPAIPNIPPYGCLDHALYGDNNLCGSNHFANKCRSDDWGPGVDVCHSEVDVGRLIYETPFNKRILSGCCRLQRIRV